MGGKTSQQTSSVTIPPEILQRYQAVNQRAEDAASKPFQLYSQDPSAFVAPLNSTQNAGVAGTNAAANQAQPYFDAARGQLTQAQNSSQPYIDASRSVLGDAQQSAQRYLDTAYQGTGAALRAGSGLAGASLSSLNAANQNASPLNQQAGGYYSSAYQGAQPYNQAAGAAYAGGVSAAQPFNQQAAAGLTGALAGAQPYNQIATGLGLGGAQAVNPDQLNAANINQYLSPYLSTVLGGTAGMLNQQNQQQQSGQMGQAIQQGWFGGDRGGIAAANLAQQQQLANSKIYSDILNQGYGQALSTAQQQQGVGLGAAQSNRAALSGAAGQLAALGQQTYGQGTGTAQAQAGLGQQVFGQGIGAGEAAQGLGQQVFGQGTGTGSAVQGLGQQVFGQGLATSQQQAAVGQQQFQQALQAAQAQAAMGQQQYGMGSNTAQQFAGLGQQQYGMGANTSQQLAGLGANAQGAALSGAQAQLGAGQIGQQTQQAGLTALYNQFLQQQSYPFQTAQFLANIAEGTGSLSGSTTTTTQPGGFFSDERLKENIREVGKTYDGQPIVTYSYKDEPNVIRMGLIAQDVERKHPGAVGESAGFKTVDYGKATDKAAERGHFAGGGMPTLPGLSGADMAALLQAQQQMYAPYGEGGLYGGQASGLPHGGASYVPQSNVPVSSLTVAAPAPAQPSPMEQAKMLADLAVSGEKLWDSDLGKKIRHDDDKSDEKRNGGRTALAAGGVPYGGSGLDIPNEAPSAMNKPGEGAGSPVQQQSGLGKVKDLTQTALNAVKLWDKMGFAAGGGVGGGLDIPNEQSKYELKLPDTPGTGNSKSGLSNTKDAVQAALAVAKLAAMLANGGAVRKGYAEGGAPDDPDTPWYKDRTPVFSSQGLAGKVGSAIKGGLAAWDQNVRAGAAAREAGPKYQDHGRFYGPDGFPVTPPRAGESYSPGKTNLFGDAVVAAGNPVTMASGVSAPAQMTTAPLAASNILPHRQPTPSPHIRPAGGLAAPAPMVPAAPQAVSPLPVPERVPMTPGLGAVPNAVLPDANARYKTQGLGASDIGDAIGRSPIGGYLKGLKHGNTADWMSLLAGIGAMGTAPTVHPGVALAAGLTGGTQAYMGTKKTQAELAQRAAATETQRATTKQTEAMTLASVAPPAPEGSIAVPGPGPDGKYTLGKDGSHWHFELPVNSTYFGPQGTPHAATNVGAGPSADTDAYVQSNYHIDPSQLGVANRTRAFASNPELVPLDAAAHESVQKRIGDLGDVETSRRQTVQLAQAYNDLPKTGLMSQGHASDRRAFWANVYATARNMAGVAPDPTINEAVSDNQVIGKLKAFMGPAAAGQYGQKAASIAHEISGVIPSGDMSPQAANELLASFLVQAEMPAELAQYKDAYVNRYGIMAGVEPAFRRDTASKYAADQKALAQFMQTPGFGRALADMQSSDPEVRLRAINTVDGVYHAPISRYFTGGNQ